MSSAKPLSRLKSTNLVYLLLGDLREALDARLTEINDRRWTGAVLNQLLAALTEEANAMESEGYLAGVCEEWPNWSGHVERLSDEHALLRDQLHELRNSLQHAGPTGPQLQHFKQQLREWMTGISAHQRHESRLLQMAYMLDVGAAD